ncbi:hypothetical protein J6590_007928 [Homalodisca vitripennis]|nr:hypothetical protein J6590_007928 [Homalodisca vitripennis]
MERQLARDVSVAQCTGSSSRLQLRRIYDATLHAFSNFHPLAKDFPHCHINAALYYITTWKLSLACYTHVTLKRIQRVTGHLGRRVQRTSTARMRSDLLLLLDSRRSWFYTNSPASFSTQRCSTFTDRSVINVNIV